VRQDDKSITLGHPSYVWRFGQDRRLELIRRFMRFPGVIILDVGCGIGTYIEKFRDLGGHEFGVDSDSEKLNEAHGGKKLLHIAASVSEALPFPDETFHVVLLHEVIEHVTDDRMTIREAHRVLKRNGRVLVFAPNRLYPFETHGAYLNGKYVFGNIPFIGWLPDSLRNKYAPHVRAYRLQQIRDLFQGLDGDFLLATTIFPGYDKIARRNALVAKLLRWMTYALERTPLRMFGLSHFVVWKKFGWRAKRVSPFSAPRTE
jgi:SAM-dependent methyltransferase